MELQEFSILAAIGQVRYPLSSRYPSARGQLLEEVIDAFAFPTWGWGDEFLNFHNEDRSLTLIAGGRESRAQFMRVEDIETVIDTSTRLFALALERFNVQQVDFVGARTFWAAAVDSFEDLRDALVGQLGSSTFAAMIDAAAQPVSDAGWVLEFHDKDPKHSLRFGPMKREQAVAQFVPDAKLEDLPASFLFLDVDRVYNDEQQDAQVAVKRWEQSFRKNVELAGEIGRVLTGIAAVR